MATTDSLTPLQESIGLSKDPKDTTEVHDVYVVNKSIEKTITFTKEDLVEDQVDFNNAGYSGAALSQDNIWEAEFLDFSRWMRKTYFKDVSIQDMQAMNKQGFFNLCVAITVQFCSYFFLQTYYPQYFWFWAAPLLFFCIYLVQFGEIVHTRVHWPKRMTGSDTVDSLVDWSCIALTGASKESFRRRHVVAHYADVANASRIFSDVWIPFIQFPAVYWVYPHKLMKMFLDVEYCRRENLSRRQILIEMVVFYSYMTLMIYELIFTSTCFLSCFHMAPCLLYEGAQIAGAQISHSGIDRRNSFNSNGLFDWRDATGLFKVSLFVVDKLANGGVSNHGIHHSHTQMPLHMINKNLREINAYARKTYSYTRYNQILAMIQFDDLLAKMPPVRWYDYIIQAIVAFFNVVYCVVQVMGVPIPPTCTFEVLLLDYRFFFYTDYRDYADRVRLFLETLKLYERRDLVLNPNVYLLFVCERLGKMQKYVKENPPPHPAISCEEFGKKLCPKEIFDFTVNRPLEQLAKKKQ